MKYIYMIMIFCMFSMTSLNAKKSELSDILQKAGEKKIIVKPPASKKKQSGKASQFIFKDTYNPNVIGIKQNKRVENTRKSKNYDYENKSRFKFKFTPGTDVSNIVSRQGSGSGTAGGGGARMSGGGGGGQGGGGGRK